MKWSINVGHFMRCHFKHYRSASGTKRTGTVPLGHAGTVGPEDGSAAGGGAPVSAE